MIQLFIIFKSRCTRSTWSRAHCPISSDFFTFFFLFADCRSCICDKFYTFYVSKRISLLSINASFAFYFSFFLSFFFFSCHIFFLLLPLFDVYFEAVAPLVPKVSVRQEPRLAYTDHMVAGRLLWGPKSGFSIAFADLNLFLGRLRQKCPEHPRDKYLLDFDSCPKCGLKTDMKKPKISEFPLPEGAVSKAINKKIDE